MHNTINKNWVNIISNELINTQEVKIISPFITLNILKHIFRNFNGEKIEVITRFNLNDFKSRASSLEALKYLLEKYNCKIKGIKNLHSKVYLFDDKSTIITSANLTSGGLINNKEFGVISRQDIIVKESIKYFDSLWNLNNTVLTIKDVEDWKKLLNNNTASSPQKHLLPDFGVSEKELVTKGRKYFIKFFGKNNHRENLEYKTRLEIRYGCCHYALSFSRKSDDRRPRKYKDGDIVFMARMIHGNDYAIFGKGITYSHNDNRDIAGPDDINHVSWMKDWPILIRVHSTEFIDSSLRNCPKLGDMINLLDYESFDKTFKKFQRGIPNINPWLSLRQQADIQLSDSGAIWLENEFQNALLKNGKIPESYINKFYRGIKI